MIPEEYTDWAQDMAEANPRADLSFRYREGGTESFEGESTGPGQYAVGTDLEVSIDGAPLRIDAGLGRAESGAVVLTAQGKAVELDQAAPFIALGGLGFLAVAAYCLKRGSIQPAAICALFGLGLIGILISPWVLVLSLVAIVGGLVFYFRDSLRLPDTERALKAAADVVGQLGGTDEALFKDSMSARIGKDKHAKAAVKRAKK